MALPEIGLYIGTKKDKSMRLYLKAAYGNNPDGLYLVEIVDVKHAGNESVMGMELERKEWESFVVEYGLEHQHDRYIKFCMESLLNPNSESSCDIYTRHLDKTKILIGAFSAESGSYEQKNLIVEYFK